MPFIQIQFTPCSNPACNNNVVNTKPNFRNHVFNSSSSARRSQALSSCRRRAGIPFSGPAEIKPTGRHTLNRPDYCYECQQLSTVEPTFVRVGVKVNVELKNESFCVNPSCKKSMIFLILQHRDTVTEGQKLECESYSHYSSFPHLAQKIYCPYCEDELITAEHLPSHLNQSNKLRSIPLPQPTGAAAAPASVRTTHGGGAFAARELLRERKAQIANHKHCDLVRMKDYLNYDKTREEITQIIRKEYYGAPESIRMLRNKIFSFLDEFIKGNGGWFGSAMIARFKEERLLQPNEKGYAKIAFELLKDYQTQQEYIQGHGVRALRRRRNKHLSAWNNLE